MIVILFEQNNENFICLFWKKGGYYILNFNFNKLFVGKIKDRKMKENFPELGTRQRLSINYFDQECSHFDAAIINIFKFACTRSIDAMSEQNDGFRKSKRPLSRNIFFRWLTLLANVYVPIAFICHWCLRHRFLSSFFLFLLPFAFISRVVGAFAFSSNENSIYTIYFATSSSDYAATQSQSNEHFNELFLFNS